jgi:hypothetical protein
MFLNVVVASETAGFSLGRILFIYLLKHETSI